MLVFWSKTEICSAMYNFFSAKNFTSPFTVKYLLTNFIVTLEQGIIIVQNKTGFISAAVHTRWCLHQTKLTLAPGIWHYHLM